MIHVLCATTVSLQIKKKNCISTTCEELYKIILVKCSEKYLASYYENNMKAIYKKGMAIIKWWVYLICIKDKVSFKELPAICDF